MIGPAKTDGNRPHIQRRQGYWFAIYQDGRIRDRTPQQNQWNLAANQYADRMNRGARA